MTHVITWSIASPRLLQIRKDFVEQVRAVQIKYQNMLDIFFVQMPDGGGTFDEGMSPKMRLFTIADLPNGGVADAFGPEFKGIPARAMNIRFSLARESYIKGKTLPFVIEHEIGHTLGLEHGTKGLMRPDIGHTDLADTDCRKLLARWGAAKTDGQLAADTLGHVIALYRMVCRDPDPEGLAYWVNTPDSLPHLIHALGLSVSTFNLAVQAYRGLLGREPSHDEAAWWGQIGSTFATSFIGTDEARVAVAKRIKALRS